MAGRWTLGFMSEFFVRRKQDRIVTGQPSQSAKQLIDAIHIQRNVVVAFSGGVDSSVVAAAATRANLDSLIAVTAQSPSVSQWQLDMAKRVAAEVNVQHRIVYTNEIDQSEYTRNDGRRCFFCKQTLYSALQAISSSSKGATILSGTNADDLGDYRPGIQAGKLAQVKTPLADLGMTKPMVRELAVEFGLSNANQPAAPCLSSRIAYGVEVTSQRLQRVERAEAWLREQGFRDFRVRVHADELARVEVPTDEIERLLQKPIAEEMDLYFRKLGFKYVTVDLSGLRSGNLNQSLVQINTGG